MSNMHTSSYSYNDIYYKLVRAALLHGLRCIMSYCLLMNQSTAIHVTQAVLDLMGKDKGGSGGLLIHTASHAGKSPIIVSGRNSFIHFKSSSVAYCNTTMCHVRLALSVLWSTLPSSYFTYYSLTGVIYFYG